MVEVNSTTGRRRRAPAWVYMMGGAVGLLVLYGFFFRRNLLDQGLWESPVRGPMIGLLGAALGWFVYRISSRPG